MSNAEAAAPLYLKVKRRLLDDIAAGTYQPGARIPSEHALVKETGASRMTVNRALRELADEGAITRVQGAGSFVAEPTPASDLLELRNIADEIAARGRRHSVDILSVARAQLAPGQASRMGLAAGAAVFHSRLVHLQDGVPVQLEDRLVNPAVAPDYPTVDFTLETPNAYLTRVAPATAAEHAVEAVPADPATAKLLRIAPNAPCLGVDRRTWAGTQVASLARLTYPAARYRLTAGRPIAESVPPL